MVCDMNKKNNLSTAGYYVLREFMYNVEVRSLCFMYSRIYFYCTRTVRDVIRQDEGIAPCG